MYWKFIRRRVYWSIDHQRVVSRISLMIKLAFCRASSISAASRRLAAMCGDSSRISSFFEFLYNDATSSDCKLSFTSFTRKCIMAFGTESWMLLRTIRKYDLISRSIMSQSRCSRGVSFLAKFIELLFTNAAFIAPF